jgi:hypothetical protein
MIKKDLQNIGNAYGDMLNALKHTIVKESKNQPPNAFDENFPKQDGGLDEKGGATKALNDDHPSNCECGCKEEDNEEEDNEGRYKKSSKMEKQEMALRADLKNPDLSDKQREIINRRLKELERGMERSESEEEKELQESRKMGKQILNKVMTRKTLSFDKLFRSVVNENYMGGPEDAEDDAAAFGLDDEMTDDEMDSDFGGGEDEVTFTLDRATAQKLHDVLMTVLGGEEEGGDEGEGEDELEFDMGDEGEDDMMNREEDEETPAIGKLTGRPNTVGKVKAKGGKASSDVTDKVGDDGDYGHALYNAKQPNIGAGSNNKVGNYKKGAEYIK